MTAGITAEDIVRLFEEDARARKRLAELLISEPDVRLAIINAVLREVATKQDLREAVRELREYMDTRFKELKEYVDTRIRELREYVDARTRELREHMDGRFSAIEDRLGRLENEVRELREEVRELHNRLWWVVATVILGWIGTALLQILLLLLRH